MGENYTKIFYQDVREKKKAASGIFHRASRKGYIKGGVKTQSDFLTPKQKRMLSGEVKMSNKYDNINNIPKWDELKQMEKNAKVNIMKIAKAKHSGPKLAKHWGISYGTLNSHFAKLGLTNQRPVKDDKNLIHNISELMNYDEFSLLDVNAKRIILTNACNIYSKRSIMTHWDIPQSTFYRLLREFDLVGKSDNSESTAERQLSFSNEEVGIPMNTNINEKITQEVINNSNNEELMKTLELILNKLEENKKESSKEEVSTGFKLEFNGLYNKEELETRLLNITQIAVQDKQYKIKFCLEEV